MGDRWQAAAALVDRTRRALYDYVRRQDHPVSREEAADAQRVSRNLAAFHLDKLVEAGLLRARYEAPAGAPRGRGRTPKVYEATGDGVAVTVPERRYELVAQILAAAVDTEPGNAHAAALAEAGRRGRDLGGRHRGEDLTGVLAGLGFEPERAPGRLLLANCPFHDLARHHTALVCGLNHAFLAGLVEGLGAAGTARLAPGPGRCCVEVADR
ncbi:MAG TPA: helix-turn-helix domain-containing protein [Mycobacteriales bacterium]|nr:helix-turn-helix domain-containing protein [Mycobacteriales bacterium]